MNALQKTAARAIGWAARSFNIPITEFGRWMDVTSGFGLQTYSGVRVSERSAIRNATVYACWKILSEDIASLPFPVYRRMERGKRRDRDHPVYRILHDEANPEMSAFTARQVLAGHLLLWGNAYAEKEESLFTGDILAIWPLLPWNMNPRRLPDGTLVYKYMLPNGEVKTFRRDQIWHIVGNGFDGLVGQSPIAMARQGIGIALAGEELAGRMFGNNTHFGGFLQHPKKLSPEARENLRATAVENHGGDGTGLSKTMRLKILEEGMTYSPGSMPMRDAQWLESRKFQKLEIAQFFRMQPHKVLSMEDGVSYASIEQQNIDYVMGTLRPWLVLIEQSANMQLFRPEERREWFAEHVIEGILRGDADTRSKFYNQMFQVGAFSPNDILEMENRNPVEGGDERFVPMNMVPLSQALQPLPELQEPDDGRSLKPMEDRAMRSLQGRNRTTQQFRRIFRDAAQRVVNREVADVRRAAKRMLGERNEQEFFSWLEEFYSESATWIARTMAPAFQSFAESIASIAAEEVNMKDVPQEDVQRFVSEYGTAFSARHRFSSHGQIRQITEDTLAAGEDPVPAIDRRLSEWEQKEADKIASRETIQEAGAVTRLVYSLGGVTTLRWVAQGSEACPYCQEMNGRTVGIQQNFLREGEAFDPTGEKGPLKIRGPISHPPLHEGCVCSISPA